MKAINCIVLSLFLIISVYNVFGDIPARNKDLEAALIDVNLDQMVGNWTLRAATVFEKEPLFTHSVAERTGDGLTVTRYFQTTEQGKAILTKIPGSRAIKVDIPNHNFTTCPFVYPFHADATYLVLLCVTENGTDPTVHGLQVYAKNGSDYDSEEILDLLLKINEKTHIKDMIRPFIFRVEFKAFNLTAFMLKPSRIFKEDELATVDNHQISSVYDLRYSTDTDRLYDYQIQLWCEKSKKLKIYRFRDGELRQNLSDYHVFDTKRMRRAVQAVPRRSNYVKSAVSVVNYLYIDQDYIVTYEFYQIYENLRVYAKQGVVGSVDEYKRVINKIPASAIAKVQDLIPKMQMQYSSYVRQKDIDYSKFNGDWVIHKLIIPHHVDIDKLQITFNNTETHESIYFNNTVVDEVIYTPYPGLPTRYTNFKSIRHPTVHGAGTIVFTDYTTRTVATHNGTMGLLVAILSRPGT